MKILKLSEGCIFDSITVDGVEEIDITSDVLRKETLEEIAQYLEKIKTVDNNKLDKIRGCIEMFDCLEENELEDKSVKELCDMIRNTKPDNLNYILQFLIPTYGTLVSVSEEPCEDCGDYVYEYELRLPSLNQTAPYYCNEYVELKIGGIKVPRGGREYLQKLVDSENNLLELFDDEDISQILIEDINNLYNVDTENVLLPDNPTLETTKSGVDFVPILMGGDWELPVQAFIYWDGNNYRCYIPLKGNTINTVNNAAFGNCHDYCKNEGDMENDNINPDLKYLKQEFGDSSIDTYDLEIDLKACIEDFEARVEVV